MKSHSAHFLTVLRLNYIKERARRRHGEDAPSEVRLTAVWTGQILVPVRSVVAFLRLRTVIDDSSRISMQAGLLIYGFGIQLGAAWPGPIVGMGVACFGVQCITTVMFVIVLTLWFWLVSLCLQGPLGIHIAVIAIGMVWQFCGLFQQE